MPREGTVPSSKRRCIRSCRTRTANFPLIEAGVVRICELRGSDQIRDRGFHGCGRPFEDFNVCLSERVSPPTPHANHKHPVAPSRCPEFRSIPNQWTEDVIACRYQIDCLVQNRQRVLVSQRTLLIRLGAHQEKSPHSCKRAPPTSSHRRCPTRHRQIARRDSTRASGAPQLPTVLSRRHSLKQNRRVGQF